MPDYGMGRKNTGGLKIKDGTDGNYDQGNLGGFRTNKGAANKRSLANDNGAGGGRFVDTNNDQSGDGHGGGYKKPRAGDSR
jgi:hypothetical protein